MKVKVKCEVCGKEEMIYKSRESKYKTCSIKCRSKKSSTDLSKKIKITCGFCKCEFEIKPSQKTRRNYCSKNCQAKAYETRYAGKRNPNYKGCKLDYDKYPIHLSLKTRRRTNIHREVVLDFLNLNEIPKGYNVHHKDCDKINNKAENLVLLSDSDHRWLHKNFGNATLWAINHDKITAEEVSGWCSVSDRALQLLKLSLKNQIGVFKSDELLETPEEDNQQPSFDLNDH